MDQYRLENVVYTVEEFDRVVPHALAFLLDRASDSIKQYLRETGQWKEDVLHEKLVLRWAAEFLERFLVCGRSEVPCRPLFLLDSLIAKQHSQPEPFCYHPDLLTPLGRFLDGLAARACISRDGLIALYHHWYGLSPAEIIAIAGLNGAESSRVYKNLQRWRESGWQKTMIETGMTEAELQRLERQVACHAEVNEEARRTLRVVQEHYRKSEPDHYLCRSSSEWEAMLAYGHGTDYRLWHLAFCPDCIQTNIRLRSQETSGPKKVSLDLHVRP